MIKRFGLAGVFAGMVVLACFGIAGCSEDDKDSHVHDYGDWVVDQVADKDHIGKKHRDCNSCGNSERVDDASKFFSHVSDGNGWWIVDKNGKVKWDWDDKNGNGISTDYKDGIIHDENGEEECSLNLEARKSESQNYGKKHFHLSDNTTDYKVYWDKNDNEELDWDDLETKINIPYEN